MALTANQVNYINILVERRAEMYDRVGMGEEAKAVRETATTIDVWNLERTAIDALKEGNERIRARLAEIAPKTPKVELTDGMYRTADGKIYKLQWNREKTNLYGKELITETFDGETTSSFVYAPGVTRRVTLDDKMTLEEAKEYGKLYSNCVVCGRKLTNEQSIAEGIGPICSGRM